MNEGYLLHDESVTMFYYKACQKKNWKVVGESLVKKKLDSIFTINPVRKDLESGW